MFKGSTRLQPDSFLGVFIMKEETIVVGVTEAFDFREPLTNLRAGVNHSRLKNKHIIKLKKKVLA